MLTRTTRRPHIAFVLPGLGAGGSENIVNMLCNSYAAQGWETTLFAFEDAGREPYYRHDPAVRIVALGHRPERRGPIGGVVAMAARTRALRRALRAARPDLIVSFLTRTNVVALMAAGPTPVIVSERNNPALQSVGPVWSRLRSWAYPHAAALVTMTQGAMNHFPPAIRAKGVVIPNPAAAAPPGAEDRASDGRTIGAVGRLVHQKGFDRLIDAFARVADRHPGWRLAIWGEGPLRAALEEQRDRLGLRDRITLPGVTTRPGEWIARSDIFVLSSRFEGWGIVVGEAMAGGVPTISFDCDFGPAEMIEPGVSGLLVREGDVPALGGAISALCDDAALRDRLGAAGRARMRLFDRAQVIGLWEQLIGRVLAASAREVLR